MKDKPDALIGRTIASKYLIEEKIGQGGMGSVYRARHIVTGKVLAIKVLLEDLAAYDSFVQRFLHEARAAAFLTNPHIINIVDCGRDGEVVYLLMEHLEGRTLTELIRAEGPFSISRAARILGQICSALADAHSHSIIHRDLKPDNIILRQVAGERDYVKVLDLGIAKVLDDQRRASIPSSRNVFIGTPEYASPEQCNSKPLSHLSDIYSAGVILFEMLAGRPPFIGDPMDVMLQHVSRARPALRDLGIEVGREIEGVVERALRKNPTDRYQNALEFAGEFQLAVNRQRRLSAELPPSGSPVARQVPGVSPEPKAGAEGPIAKFGLPVAGTRSSSGPKMGSNLEPAAGSHSVPRTVKRSEPRMGSHLEHTAGRTSPGQSTIRPSPHPAAMATPRPLRTVLFALMSVLIFGGLLSAAYLSYEFYAWYTGSLPLPSPPGPSRPPSLEAANDPLAGARLLMDQGNRDGAMQEIRRSMAKPAGENPAAHTLLGALLYDQGDLDGASEQFRLALEKSDGQFVDALYLNCLLRWDQGDQEGALEQLRQASSISTTPQILAALGRFHIERGERDVATRYLDSLTQAPAKRPEDSLQIGQAYLLRRQFVAAERFTRLAIERRGDFYPEGYLQLGEVLLGSGKQDQALEAIRRAVEQRGGNYPAGRYALGSALYQRGEVQRALAEFRAAVRLRGGNYPEAELGMATVLADSAIGAYEEAGRELESALRQRSGHYPEAREALGSIAFFRYGRLEEARRGWEEASTENARTLLKATADAFAVQSSGDAVARMIGDMAPPDNSVLSFEFAAWPANTGEPSIFLACTGDTGLLVQFQRQSAESPKILTYRITGSERTLVASPISGDAFRQTNAARVRIRFEPSKVTFFINEREVCRFGVRAGEPLTATVRDVRAILYHFQNVGTSRAGSN